METKKIQLNIKIINRFDRDVMFRLEPWSDEYQLLKGKYVTVVAKGENNGLLEVEYGQDCITVYGWAGSTCEVIVDP